MILSRNVPARWSAIVEIVVSKESESIIENDGKRETQPDSMMSMD